MDITKVFAHDAGVIVMRKADNPLKDLYHIQVMLGAPVQVWFDDKD